MTGTSWLLTGERGYTRPGTGKNMSGHVTGVVRDHRKSPREHG